MDIECNECRDTPPLVLDDGFNWSVAHIVGQNLKYLIKEASPGEAIEITKAFIRDVGKTLRETGQRPEQLPDSE